MPNPWDNDPIVQPAATAPIMGVPLRPDPYKVRDQQLQEGAALRAEEDQNFQRQKFEWEKQKQALPPKDAKTTMDERGAAGFYRRAVNAHQKYAEGVLPRGPIAQSAIDVLPESWENTYFDGADRRAAKNYAEEFIRAKLRKESGASIPPAEMEQEYRVYFPVPGDEPADLERKKGLREEAIAGLKLASGGEAEAALEGLSAPLADDETTKGLKERIARGDDPADTIQWLISVGHPPNKEEIAAIIANAGNKNPDVRPPEPGLGQQLLDATGNVIGGIVEGIGSLPDMAAKALGAGLAIPADALGFTNVARDLRNPITIGGMTREVLPESQAQGGTTARVASQFAGGIVGFPQKAAQAVTNRIVGNAPPLPNAFAPSGSTVMRAADELSASTGQKIQPLAADVAGPTTRRLTSVGAQLPLSARPIVKAAQNLTEQAQGARNVVANRVGEAVDPEMAGEAVKRGLSTFRTKTSGQARTMYQAAEEAAEGVPVQPKTLLTKLGDYIREESQVVGGSDVMPILEKLATDLSTQGSFSISGVRGMRTVLMSRLTSAGMTPTNAQRIVGDLVKAAGDDISTSLTAAGKANAAKAYRSADKFWAERMEVVNEAIKPIVGRNNEKSGEQVVAAIQQAAKGNAARLAQVMRALPEEDAATIQATIISQLGRSSAGTQNAAGNAFSLNQFLTHWNQMTPRARSLLFTGRSLEDLNNLAKVAAGSKEASRYANSSNTGSVMGGLATGATVATDFLTMAGTALSQVGGGLLLASPGFARWMAKAPASPAGMKAHLARLSTVASQNPALADDIARFQQAMMGAANENVGSMSRAAASDGADSKAR